MCSVLCACVYVHDWRYSIKRKGKEIRNAIINFDVSQWMYVCSSDVMSLQIINVTEIQPKRNRWKMMWEFSAMRGSGFSLEKSLKLLICFGF